MDLLHGEETTAAPGYLVLTAAAAFITLLFFPPYLCSNLIALA